MKKIIGLVFALFVAFFSTIAVAGKTNFSYSTVGITVGKINLDQDLCASGWCVSSMGSATIGGSVQFADDLLVASFSSSATVGDTPAWTYTSGVTALGLAVVTAITDRVDIRVGVEALSGRNEVCAGGNCVSYTDTGNSYGGAINAWLDESRTWSGSFGLESSKFSKSTSSTTTKGLSVGRYFNSHHRVYGVYQFNDSSTGVGVGYGYHF